ncbi:hypothetical protein SELMODRAFT_420515 [Selaginella moellendorffii]|uniref:Uncharacterized protein n=1 Tax=Selaginella moellendorffii TaxID=88036 RepID=D8SC88_SELML|nr:hypothetical protein SELMODRAFT_420515 [Selaginella moellendorffii]
MASSLHVCASLSGFFLVFLVLNYLPIYPFQALSSLNGSKTMMASCGLVITKRFKHSSVMVVSSVAISKTRSKTRPYKQEQELKPFGDGFYLLEHSSLFLVRWKVAHQGFLMHDHYRQSNRESGTKTAQFKTLQEVNPPATIAVGMAGSYKSLVEEEVLDLLHRLTVQGRVITSRQVLLIEATGHQPQTSAWSKASCEAVCD